MSRHALQCALMYIAAGMPPRPLVALPTFAITCFLSYPRCCAIRDERPFCFNTSTIFLTNAGIMFELVAFSLGSRNLKGF